MSGRTFLDTNIFVYAYDGSDPRKQRRAIQLIRDSLQNGRGVISYQVIHEFFNVALVKNPVRMSAGDARRFLETVFRRMGNIGSSAELVSDAIGLHDRHQLSWYDSLIVAAALQAQCSVLYSEDFQHGRSFGQLRVENPFV
jgi:predicted nucleic acid-binding protein